MNAAAQIRKQADAAIYWLGCVELAQVQGDAPAAELGRVEHAQGRADDSDCQRYPLNPERHDAIPCAQNVCGDGSASAGQ